MTRLGDWKRVSRINLKPLDCGLHFSDNFIASGLLFCFGLAFVLILLQACIPLADNTLGLCESPDFPLHTHAVEIRRASWVVLKLH